MAVDRRVRVVVEVFAGAIPIVRLENRERRAGCEDPLELVECRGERLVAQVLEQVAREGEVDRPGVEECEVGRIADASFDPLMQVL